MEAGANLSQAAEQLLKEIQDLDQEQGPAKSGGQQFQKVMDAQQLQGAQDVSGAQGVGATQHAGAVQPKPSAVSVIQAAQLQSVPGITVVGAAAKARKVQSLNLIRDLVSGQDKMGKIMQMALSKKKFSNNELLALQAGMHHFSQEMELTSKVVQTLQQDLKTLLTMQV